MRSCLEEGTKVHVGFDARNWRQALDYNQLKKSEILNLTEMHIFSVLSRKH